MGEISRDDQALIAAYEEQITLHPRSTIARYKLGLLLARLGRLDAAIEQWREGVRIDPNNLAARLALDEALSYLERKKRGQATFQSDHGLE